jgi:hypothetical protein
MQRPVRCEGGARGSAERRGAYDGTVDDVDGEDPPTGEATAPSRADPGAHRYPTPTGEPCPRTVRVDGTVEGTGGCTGCGCCLLGSGLV